MKNKKLFILFLIIFSFSCQRAFAETHISGDLNIDTTWTKENSPYVVDDSIYVSSGVTLNIESGVTVKFSPNTSLRIYGGSIQAIGTSKDKIYFTSLAEDDLNLWDGIRVSNAGDAQANLSFRNTVIRYGYTGLSICKIQNVVIDNSIFEKNQNGITDCGNSRVTISNTKIVNNDFGIYLSQANDQPNSIYTVSNLSIYGNKEYGIYNETYAPPVLCDNWQKSLYWLASLFQPGKAFAEEYDYTVDFRNTWWGDVLGPQNDETNSSGLSNKVSSLVLFSPWITKDPEAPKHNPVIIVPGVMGTEINKTTDNGIEKLWLDLVHNLADLGDEFMDPLQFNDDLTPSDTSLTIGGVIGKETFIKIPFDYTDGLVKEFQNQGYVEGTDLFLFPYDWRYGVSEDNVNQLKQKIKDILNQTGAEKVDIVAHSMGGLLVKKYIIENPEDNNINKAVFVGVPNTGAPKAIKALIQGDGNLLTADSEMKKISKNILAAYDLLPSEQYFNTKGSYVKIIDQYNFSNQPKDLNFEESSIFLINDHKLNAQALIDANNLHTANFDNYDLRTAGVDLYAIDGCRAGTTGKFIEARYHGLLGGDDYTINNFKIEEIPGDGTVPLESATNLPINETNKFYALKGEHGQMLSQEGTRQKIVNIISGSALLTNDNKGNDIITQDISECKLNGRAISIFSPLSINVVDQDGNHAGLSSDGISIENNIPNADFQIIDEHKFIYLPTDEGQNYTITVTGTGTGTFTITDASIDANNITQTQVFSNISVTPSLLGSISFSNNTNTILSLDTDGDGATDQILEPTSILNAIESQDFVPEQEVEVTTPPQNNTNAIYGSGGGASYPFVILSNNIPIQSVDNALAPLSAIIAEVPLKNLTLKQDNTTQKVLVSVKKIKNGKPLPQSKQTESSTQGNILSANVINSQTPVDYKIIIGSFAGIIFLFLVAKKFIKL